MLKTTQWTVIKFGGSSVRDLSCWQTIARVSQKHSPTQRVLIVCSALAGITDQLEQLIVAAEQNQQAALLQTIIQRYQTLGKDLGVDFDSCLQTEVEALSNLVTGISLIQEVSPNIHAKILAFGEIFLTKLGAAFLQKKYFPVTWCDARQVLKSVEQPHTNERARYLLATCEYQPDSTVIDFFNRLPTACVITQGFIASNIRDETVILGRGGSDTSAAYFAAKLMAQRCEIWTDVPGIYTANPHEIPEARLLKHLDYDEAQEIASMGAKVLHPQCLPPLKANQIPLSIACTHKSEHPGTEITIRGDRRDMPFKSILSKYQITLIQIESIHMWQQIGFLADIFACFKKHGLSIDLISTSESTVTVSLDLKINRCDAYKLDNLLADLNTFSKANSIGPCAAISIVGRNIRSILHKLGSALTVFEEQKIYLISQAANDLNLTFVVDENQALRLVRELHALLIETSVVEKSFQEAFLGMPADEKKAWWQTHKDALLALAADDTPLYVYHEGTVAASIRTLRQLQSVDQIFYAIKANDHADLLRQMYEAGLGFECVSLPEIQHILNLFPTIDRKRILFTPNFAPKEEYAAALRLNIFVTIDNLHPLMYWPELFRNQEILLRFDPGKGYGHHHFVCTGGQNSKFGIPVSEIPQLKEWLKKTGAKVIGLHAHVGSGILDSATWRENASFLASLLPHFPKVRIMNVGGGFGVVEKRGQRAIDWPSMDKELLAIKKLISELQLWVEPGRFLVAEAGVLITKVTQIKQKGETIYVGVDAGMNSLIRPALYGAYHEIVNLSRLDATRHFVAHVVGPICESGDTLGFSRLLPEDTREGDVLLIANAGAYGRVMSSHYNRRMPAEEFILGSVASSENSVCAEEEENEFPA